MVKKNREQRKKLLEQVDLYPVITESFCNGRTSIEVLESVLAAGVRIVQLREKSLSKHALYELGKRWKELCDQAFALLIINDHLDVALALDADGVHLGQADLPIEPARKIAPELIIGISTHNKEQADSAQSAGADYVNIGPVFPTGTKPEHKHFLGPENLAPIASDLDIPFTVMGGIKAENIDQVLKTGAHKIAVVTAVTAAEDINQAAKTLRSKIQGYQ